MPVHMKGKDKTKADSCRPISLASCRGKLTERLINISLMWHLETKRRKETAFRQDRSTEDQFIYLTQETEEAFQKKKHTLAVWIASEKAFDKI